MTRKRHAFWIIFAAIIADILSVIAADLSSFFLRFDKIFPKANFNAYLELVSFIILTRIIGFYIFRFYDGVKYRTRFEDFINSVKACAVSSAAIIAVLYFRNVEFYPRSITIISFALTILFVNAWRLIAKRCVKALRGQDYFHACLLIVGIGDNAKEAALRALMDASTNYRLAGFIATASNKPVEIEREKILGTMDDLPFLIKKYRVDEIIIADNTINEKKLSTLMNMLNWENISVKASSQAYESVISSMVLYDSGALFLGPAFSAKPPPSWYWGIKRMLDILFSAFLLVLTLPVITLTAVLIKITSPGSVFYLQKRTGFNGKPFIMYKFRTMQVGAEKGNKPRWAAKNDARVTPIGTFLRRFRIDELPQLLNVLRNDMSLIGPRPERPYFAAKLMRKIPLYAERLHVRPGLTGWAQVSYQYTDTEEGAQKKLLYDLFYTHNASLALDFFIILKTFRVILTGHGAH